MSLKTLDSLPTDTLKGRAVVMAMLAAGVAGIPTAAQVTAGVYSAKLPPGLGTPILVTAEVRTSAGAPKAWDGAASYNAATRSLEANNAGTTDWTATDRVILKAWFA